MTIWDKLRSILKSEAADVGDELGKARDKLDVALTRKEEEMAATPKERMDMILDDIGDTDSEFDRILDKAQGKGATATAEAEVADSVRAVTDSDPAVNDVTGFTDVAENLDTLPPATGDAIVSGDTNRASSGREVAAEDRAAEEAAADERAAQDRAAEEAAAEERAAEERAAAAMAERRIEIDNRRAAADAKFEAQKERAGDILDELRGELGIED